VVRKDASLLWLKGIGSDSQIAPEIKLIKAMIRAYNGK